MDNNRLDRYIKDQLSGHKVGINKDDLWKGIQEKKRKKRMLWFFLPGLALLTLGAYFTLPSSNTDFESIAQNKTAGILQNQSTEKTFGPERANENQINNTAPNENLKTTLEKAKKSADLTANTFKHNVKNTALANTNKFTSSLFNKQIIQTPDQPVVSFIDNPTKNIKKEVAQNVESKNTINVIQNNIASSTNLIRNQKSIDESKNYEALTILALSRMPLLEIQREENLSIKKRYYDIIDDKKTVLQQKANRFSIGLYAAYSIVDKTLLNVSNEELFDLKNETEKALENMSYGFNIRYDLPKGLYLQTGMEFNRLQENITRLETLSVETVMIEGIIKTITYADGSSESITGEIEEIHTRTRNYDVHSTYDRWDITVGLGYQKRFKKWSVEGDVNAAFNLNSRFQGFAYDEHSKLEKNPDFYKTNLKPQVFASLGVGFHFTKRLSIFAKPQMQFNAWEATIDDYPVVHSYRLMGGRVVLRFKL